MLPGVERAIMRMAEFIGPLTKEISNLNKNLSALTGSLPAPWPARDPEYFCSSPFYIDPARLEAVGEEDNPLCLLKGTVVINDMECHVILIEVKYYNSVQKAVSKAYQEDIEACWTLGGESRARTIDYKQREYVLTICPYGD